MKIIMISLDTTRADHLGCYGYPRPTSPSLDRMAAQGVLFDQAIAADIPTEVAHTAVFTGQVGLSTGVVSHGSESSFLPKSHAWLPRLLRDAGYTTAAVDNLYQLKEWFARGYQYYVNTSGRQRWIDGRTVTDRAKAWLREHRAEDFFLFMHYWDAHTPYLPPERYIPLFYDSRSDPFDPGNRSMDGAYGHPAYPFFKHHHYDLLGGVTDAQYVDSLYDAELRYQDDLLAELDDFLQEMGLRDDTLLILFGDHGESLSEHDIYWDHCGLYECTTRVPLIMRWPGQITPGTRVAGLVQHADIMPTVLAAAGLPVPDGLDGRSLLPAIAGRATGTREAVFLSECAWQAARGVRTPSHKFIRTRDGGVFRRAPRELYDLTGDPEERRNIAAKRPDLADQLERMLDAWVGAKLADGRPDPMEVVLQTQGLPFRRRMETILAAVGLTWEQWAANPDPRVYDAARAGRAGV